MSNVVHQYCSDFVANSLMHSVLFAIFVVYFFSCKKVIKWLSLDI